MVLPLLLPLLALAWPSFALPMERGGQYQAGWVYPLSSSVFLVTNERLPHSAASSHPIRRHIPRLKTHLGVVAQPPQTALCGTQGMAKGVPPGPRQKGK